MTPKVWEALQSCIHLISKWSIISVPSIWLYLQSLHRLLTKGRTCDFVARMMRIWFSERHHHKQKIQISLMWLRFRFLSSQRNEQGQRTKLLGPQVLHVPQLLRVKLHWFLWKVFLCSCKWLRDYIISVFAHRRHANRNLQTKFMQTESYWRIYRKCG